MSSVKKNNDVSQSNYVAGSTADVQQTSSAQALGEQIKQATTEIPGLTNSVSNLTTTLSSATSNLSALQAQLGAHPKDKKLKEQVAAAQADVDNVQQQLSAAKATLEDRLNTIAQLTAQLPLKQQEDETRSNSEKQAKETQADAAQRSNKDSQVSSGQQAVDKAADALRRAKNAVGASGDSAGSAQDSYSAPAKNVKASFAGVNDSADVPAGENSQGAAVSNSGSSLDAKSLLAQAGLSGDGVQSWAKEHSEMLKKQFGQSLVDSILDSLNKGGGDDDKSSNNNNKKAASKGTSKAAVAPGTQAPANSQNLGASTRDGPISGQDYASTSNNSTSVAGIGDASANTAGMTANEIMMLVMLIATDEVNKEMQDMSKQLLNITNQKAKVRGELNDATQAMNGLNSSASPNSSEGQQYSDAKTQVSNKQNELDTLGDDTQMMQLRLQNLMQQQQQLVQGVSSMSKSLNDTSMSILRHIGS